MGYRYQLRPHHVRGLDLLLLLGFSVAFSSGYGWAWPSAFGHRTGVFPSSVMARSCLKRLIGIISTTLLAVRLSSS